MDKKIIYLKSDILIPAAFNPETRTSEKNISGIVSAMKSDGFLWYCPILITAKNEIGDGHRRWHSARKTGISSVPCLVVDKTPEEIWVSVNSEKRTLTERELLRALSLGLSIIPEKKKAVIAEIKRILGEDGVTIMAENGVSPYVLTVSKAFVKACGENYSADDSFLRLTVLWMIEHKAQKISRYYLERGAGGDELAAYVLENKSPLGIW